MFVSFKLSNTVFLSFHSSRDSLLVSVMVAQLKVLEQNEEAKRLSELRKRITVRATSFIQALDVG
jgi:hypothetical protein